MAGTSLRVVRSPLAPKMTMTNGGRTRSGFGVGPEVLFLADGTSEGAVAGLMAGYNGRFRLFRGHYEPWPLERWL